MKVYWQSQVVNPPLPTYLDGYVMGRRSTRIHDDINVQTLLIQSQETVAIISVDVLLIEEAFKSEIQQRLVDSCQLKKENILITATHTHSAPQISNFLFADQPYDEDYRKQIMTVICRNVQYGLQHMVTTHLSYKEVDTRDFYTNRDSQDSPYNPWSYMLRFYDEKEEVIVDVLNFLCHPTVLHAENLHVSSDLIGGIRNNYPQPLMILLGECGDVSTRFTRKEATFAEVERIASGISQQLLTGQWMTLRSEDVQLRTFSFQHTYNPSADSFLQKSQKKLEILVQQDENYRPILELLKKRRMLTTQTMKLQAYILKVGEVAFVFVPCEIVYALGKVLRQATDKLFIVGYTNGFLGYAVNQASYEFVAESLVSEIPYGQADNIFQTLAQSLKEEG